jgi:hypothetical protein
MRRRWRTPSSVLLLGDNITVELKKGTFRMLSE